MFWQYLACFLFTIKMSQAFFVWSRKIEFRSKRQAENQNLTSTFWNIYVQIQKFKVTSNLERPLKILHVADQYALGLSFADPIMSNGHYSQFPFIPSESSSILKLSQVFCKLLNFSVATQVKKPWYEVTIKLLPVMNFVTL